MNRTALYSKLKQSALKLDPINILLPATTSFTVYKYMRLYERLHNHNFEAETRTIRSYSLQSVHHFLFSVNSVQLRLYTHVFWLFLFPCTKLWPSFNEGRTTFPSTTTPIQLQWLVVFVVDKSLQKQFNNLQKRPS